MTESGVIIFAIIIVIAICIFRGYIGYRLGKKWDEEP